MNSQAAPAAPIPSRSATIIARLATRPASAGLPRPETPAISVCVPMPRKLKIQMKLENSTVAAPSAAAGATPSRSTNAVSTTPASGSAISDNITGSDSAIRVRWGLASNGCERAGPESTDTFHLLDASSRARALRRSRNDSSSPAWRRRAVGRRDGSRRPHILACRSTRCRLSHDRRDPLDRRRRWRRGIAWLAADPRTAARIYNA